VHVGLIIPQAGFDSQSRDNISSNPKEQISFFALIYFDFMFASFFGPNEIQLIVNLALGIFSGFIIGVERESRGKDAGISTHIMVIIGAMLFTYMSYLVDPVSKSRIAAQIVSGIGFLGAGLIVKDGSNVKNLTTAASLWVAGAIGMAYGFNFRMIGIIVTIVIALVPRVPHLSKKNTLLSSINVFFKKKINNEG
jgi:putative Mg2+ transporter-C (MgtC) family protein